MIIDREIWADQTDKIDRLYREYLAMDEMAKEATNRVEAIKREVKELATEIGGANQRVILPIGDDDGAFDRIVSRRGAGVDIIKLEEILGQERYRKLVCTKEIVYTPIPEKVQVARREGKITDADIAAASTEGQLTYSLKKMTATQLARIRQEEERIC